MTNIFVGANKIEPTGRFIDTRFDLKQAELGRSMYEEGHIEGAVFWDLNKDLSDLTKNEGRHPLPDKAQLHALFEKTGLQYNDAIYIYDQGAAGFATRAWWIMHYAGFKHAYVVNGGYEAMKNSGIPISTEVPAFSKTTLNLEWNEEILVKRKDILHIVEGTKKATLIDARSPERYRGEVEPFENIAGHIPTTKNYYWEQLRKGSKLVLTSSLLEQVPKEGEVVIYCGSGVTATPVYTMLAEAGYKNIKIYMAGYSDWINHHPVEK